MGQPLALILVLVHLTTHLLGLATFASLVYDGMTRQVVYEYQPISKPHFVLAQLLHWHNHGEGGDPNQPFDDKLRGYVYIV